MWPVILAGVAYGVYKSLKKKKRGGGRGKKKKRKKKNR